MLQDFRHNHFMPAKKPPKASAEYRVAFARRLESARVAAGYETMRDFSKELGVSEATYRRWEAAETEPNIFHLQKISRLTGVSLDILISGQRRTLLAS
jgi:transcriptional regulator with XRE-family HTH domain